MGSMRNFEFTKHSSVARFAGLKSRGRDPRVTLAGLAINSCAEKSDAQRGSAA
jgi:hypothetical protein